MEINFSTHQGIQVVSVKGVIGAAEASAIRNKLEVKINQGRDKVIFDLVGYSVEDDALRDLMVNVIVYTLNRGALTACSGLPPESWPRLKIESLGANQLKMFLSLAEALDAISEMTAVVSSKKAPDKTDKEVMAEHKSKGLEKLLEKYRVFQETDKDDPFRLEFLAAKLKKDPNAEYLPVMRKAKETLVEIQTEIDELDSFCQKWAEKVKKSTLTRKIPYGEKELQLKEDTLQKNISEVKVIIAKANVAIGQHKTSIAAAKKEVTDEATDTARILKELEETLAKNSAQFETLKNKNIEKN